MNRYPNIEAERARLGMTRVALAEAIGVTPTTIYLWKNGKAQMKLENAQALSRVLGKPIEYLLEESKNAESKSGEDAGAVSS